MSSRPPGQDRFTQMSEQAAIIARKKAEIEAKIKAAAEAKESSSKVSGSQSSSTNQTETPGKSLKNRWGFKGKRSNPEKVETAQAASVSEVSKPSATPSLSSPPGPVNFKNQFSNDGSFLEQFKKMKQTTKEEPPEPKAVVAPPQPLKVEEIKPSAQEDDWYKSALARAKQIAQNMSVEPSTSSTVKSEPQESDEYGKLPCKAEPSTEKAIESNTEELPVVVDELASMVAVSGDHVEHIARANNVGEEALAFLFDPECSLYKRYRSKVESLRKGVIAESTSRKEDADTSKKSKRKSRWGDETDKVVLVAPPGILPTANAGRNPQLVQYAIKVFGSTDLEEAQWKQCEDQLKMNQVYNELLMKQKQSEIMASQGKHKYEYDSDEDVDGGTWEHKARKIEMEKTQIKADELTEAAKGKHHIGDFLPPEELMKFMSKFQAIKTGETFVDESDYVEQKLKDDNLGFKMLQRMGWSEGSGLGSEGQGITAPISQGQQSSDKKGLGTITPHDLKEGDDEFDAYRKRMMLAYRFRPNPLNNPRRAYY